ncbi:helix-turn-helix domain-containing protein [Micromonospora sp. CB01531]|uniref:helix-turn-helix domain-containing protein n=1 Tax=Micromonospora sp. CB01531 TaxID=1718947 RepID=UPI00093E8836|nr:helix-turn-helix transcriptional regulator [Micromonospora sp. CB01531]OKI69724.1 AraC family transcriptional regulator [Micromonospora sp. CB01531]
MQENLADQLTVDDMAKTALFSKFHFSRIFQRATGISPGRFLSALRLQQAKRLLRSTSLSVADVSLRVGYSSVGTFSSRFTRSVGLSPTTFRRLGGFTTHVPIADGHVVADRAGGTVRGRITGAPGMPANRVFVGMFPQRIPEGRPVQCRILDTPGQFTLDPVPVGAWHLLAHSVGPDEEKVPTADATWVGSIGPLLITRHRSLEVDLSLQPMRIVDPPVLLALLDARQSALRRERARRRTIGARHG